MSAPAVPDFDTFIHEPARLRLLAFLSLLESADFMYLLRQSGISRGNLSVQMTRLEEARLVNVKKDLVDGRPRTTYALSTQGRKALGAYKRALKEILDLLPE